MWNTVGTATATKCGHTIAVQSAVNDRGEQVTRTDGYPDPDAETFAYDALDLCYDCYAAKMDRNPMTFDQMVSAWKGR